MPNIYVDVLTADQRFGRMLALEAEKLGADVCLGEYRAKINAGEAKHFVIADLDAYFNDELDDIDSSCTIIGFSVGYEYEMTERVKACNVFLHRPFRMNELLNILVGNDMSSIVQMASKNRITSENKTTNNVLRVNSERRCAVWGNQEIALSENEYKVLDFLCARRGAPVLREEIDALLGVEDGNMSDVYICHLRRKLDNKLGLKLICTVRKKGYMLKN